MSKKFLSDIIVGLFKRTQDPLIRAMFYNIITKATVDYTKCPTAMVTIENNKVVMYVNTDFLQKMTPEQRSDILLHELEHILKGHLYQPKEDSYSWNIATDAQINQNKPSLHEMCITYKKINVEEGLLSNEVYEIIKKRQKDKSLEVSNHDGWKTVNENVAKEACKDLMRKVKEQLGNQYARGVYTSDYNSLISDLFSNNEVNWQFLNRYIGRRINYYLEPTRTRANKRFGLQYLGKKIAYNKLKIYVMTDVSGSVSDKALHRWYSILNNLQSKGHEIIEVQADTEIKSEKKFNKKHKQVTRSGSGGTIYSPALEYINGKDPDLIIVFGDGGCEKNLFKPKPEVIWILDEQCDIDVDFGKKIMLDMRKK